MSGERSSSSRPLGRRLLWGILVAALLLIALVGVIAPRWRSGRPAAPPMTYGQAPEFTLTNRDGRSVSRQDLLGSPWVANFIFTRCALSCPRMTQRMIQLEKVWPADRDTARVSFSVDPEYDTPEILEAYAYSWQIDDPRWFFLTGERETMQSIVVDGFKLAVDLDPPPGTASPEEPILHSTRFVLVDAGGAIRGYYNVLEEGELDRLAKDLRAIGGEQED